MTALARHEPPPDPAEIRPADPMVAMIERLVLDPNADLAKLEKMLEMRERMGAQAARRAFDQAIAAAKGQIGPIRKNRQVRYTNDKGKVTDYRHETLAEVERTVAPALAAHGLHYRFRVEQDMDRGGLISVTCVLAHRDGHCEETTLKGSRDDGPGRNNFQAVASAVTYFKRYSLMAILGLSSEVDAEDDDGRGGGGVTEDTLTEGQFRELRDLIERSGTDEAKFLAYLKVEALPDLPAARFAEAKAALARKLGGAR